MSMKPRSAVDLIPGYREMIEALAEKITMTPVVPPGPPIRMAPTEDPTVHSARFITNLKYVIVRHTVTGYEFPILFPDTIKHSVFRDLGPGLTIVGAGFCHQEVLSGRWVAEGESLTLRISSRPQDAEIIAQVYR